MVNIISDSHNNHITKKTSAALYTHFQTAPRGKTLYLFLHEALGAGAGARRQ